MRRKVDSTNLCVLIQVDHTEETIHFGLPFMKRCIMLSLMVLSGAYSACGVGTWVSQGKVGILAAFESNNLMVQSLVRWKIKFWANPFAWNMAGNEAIIVSSTESVSGNWYHYNHLLLTFLREIGS